MSERASYFLALLIMLLFGYASVSFVVAQANPVLWGTWGRLVFVVYTAFMLWSFIQGRSKNKPGGR